MVMIKGMTVKLHSKVLAGYDGFGAEVYEEVIKDVENVLVAPAIAEDITEGMQLYGKHAVYILHIPKGDENNWEDAVVEFFGKKWRVFGAEKVFMEELVPLDWNKQIKVESYE